MQGSGERPGEPCAVGKPGLLRALSPMCSETRSLFTISLSCRSVVGGNLRIPRSSKFAIMGPVFPKSCSLDIQARLPGRRIARFQQRWDWAWVVDRNAGGSGTSRHNHSQNAEPGLKVQIVLPRLPSTPKLAIETPGCTPVDKSISV